MFDPGVPAAELFGRLLMGLARIATVVLARRSARRERQWPLLAREDGAVNLGPAASPYAPFTCRRHRRARGCF